MPYGKRLTTAKSPSGRAETCRLMVGISVTPLGKCRAYFAPVGKFGDMLLNVGG
jgi:hypothetical protein